MDPIVELFLMSVAMFIGCYVSGKMPLILQSRENKNQLMSVFGAGMLVGTAFAVIIPEGIRSLYIDCNPHHATEASKRQVNSGDTAGVKILEEQEHSHPNNELTIALSLLFGFLFMLIVDKGASSHHNSSSGGSLLGDDPESSSGATSVSAANRKVCTATLGLVVHAAADGIALGAAAATQHSDVELIVFFAIMLHKAPTAFGLTSFLIREGSDARKINKMLLLFSAAAPIGAFLTYFILNLTGSGEESDSNNSSVAMLFSAGTFLYVATVHILPELMTGGDSSDSASHSNGELSWRQMLTLIAGAFVPVLFSIGHHH